MTCCFAATSLHREWDLESRRKNVLWHGPCGLKARIKVLGAVCVCRTQSAADEDVSEIPTPLWGRLLLQGFSLGI